MMEKPRPRTANLVISYCMEVDVTVALLTVSLQPKLVTTYKVVVFGIYISFSPGNNSPHGQGTTTQCFIYLSICMCVYEK